MSDDIIFPAGFDSYLPLRHASAPGPWYAASKGNFWYIINKNTGRSRKIGRIGAVRTNYCDVAVKEAIRRNQDEVLKRIANA